MTPEMIRNTIDGIEIHSAFGHADPRVVVLLRWLVERELAREEDERARTQKCECGCMGTIRLRGSCGKCGLPTQWDCRRGE